MKAGPEEGQEAPARLALSDTLARPRQARALLYAGRHHPAKSLALV